MIMGGLETPCLGVVALLLIFLVTLIAIARPGAPQGITGHTPTLGDTPSPVLETGFTLNHYYPLPDGYAYLEEEEGPPAIIRIEDGEPLAYTVVERTLIFEEPCARPDGAVEVRRRKIYRQAPIQRHS